MDKVNCVEIAADSKSFITGSRDTRLILWDISGRKMIFEGHSDSVNSVVIEKKGKFAASAGDDRNILIWAIESADKKMVLTYSGGIISCLLLMNHDKYLVSGGTDRVLIIWEFEEILNNLS